MKIFPDFPAGDSGKTDLIKIPATILPGIFEPSFALISTRPPTILIPLKNFKKLIFLKF